MAEKLGRVAWVDLTVEDAPRVRDFYNQVLGWSPSPVDMGGYEDFNMIPRGSRLPAAGVCHARGRNAKLPPQWLIYVPVHDMKASMEACRRLGGKIRQKRKNLCLIEDPAGAVMMLWQTK